MSDQNGIVERAAGDKDMVAKGDSIEAEQAHDIGLMLDHGFTAIGCPVCFNLLILCPFGNKYLGIIDCGGWYFLTRR